MSLLPKAAEQFRDRDYWDSFFGKVGSEAFEWYSDFVDLANVLCKYIKPRDDVLMIGCGNSTLSSDLYDTGIERITNIDLSEKVIKQMKKQNEKRRSQMTWLPMDARQMTFEDQQFSVVLDKGTIDALMSNKSDQVLSDINQILHEVERVLRLTGRFICITLAQKHILDHLSNYFYNRNSWLLRYHHIQTRKSFALPVFAFVFTKMNLKSPLIEIQLYTESDKNWLRFQDLSKAIDAIQQCQIICYRKYEFKQKFVAGSETAKIDLYEQGNSTKIRYQMIVVNNRSKSRNRPYAAFIVPKSRNLDWLYSTAEGRQQLLSEIQYSTVALIFLQPDQEYRDLEQVQKEMTDAVLDFKPSHITHEIQIPFLSSTEGIGDVRVRENTSNFIVEDCFFADQNEWKRRLRFHNNPNLIQSEIHLKLEKKNNELQPDYSIVQVDYHRAIVTSLRAHFEKKINENQLDGLKEIAQVTGRWLLIGLGGGVLTMKLLNAFPKVELIGVDIDEEMIRIGKTWFGLDDQRCSCLVEDGLAYLRRQVDEKNRFDVIIFDVNNNDNQSSLRCPHPAFLDEEILRGVRQLIVDRSGVFLLNFASRDSTNQDRVRCETSLLSNFSYLSSTKLDDDINEIMLASDKPSIDLQDLFQKVQIS